MKRTNSPADALNRNKIVVNVGDGLPNIELPLDGNFGGGKGERGEGVPDGGAPLQVVRKNTAGTATEWATLTPGTVGLSNVDNTADLEKPLSEPQAQALTKKADLIGGKVPASQLPAGALTDVAAVAQVLNEPVIREAIDARIETQVGVQVQKITSDYMAASRSEVVALGDSLTAGYSNGAAWRDEDRWSTTLDGLLPTATVLNHGFTGHLIDGTMIMVGAHKPRFSVPGGIIPADGTAVAITTAHAYGITQGILAGGTLAGVPGVLSHTIGDGFKFRSLYGASAFGITGLHEFKSSRLGTWEASTVIIWLGRQDISTAEKGMEYNVPDHIVASTKRLIEQLTPRVKQVMICGVTTRTTEETGSAQHTWVTETNNRLRELYPELFCSAQDFLRNEALGKIGITPTHTDIAKLAAGTIPPSVMDDETHISKATADVMARHFFHPFLTRKGYVD